jgi:predicted nucleotidyltransferase
VSRSLLEDVTAALDGIGARYALIGAGALAVHGIARSTFDLDLFTTDTASLDSATWETLATDSRVQLEVHRGDADDPLAGVVRLGIAGERDIDVVVGRWSWQTEAVERSRPVVVAGVRLPVVEPADLILFKLYAGGSQDFWDIEQLLAGADRQALVEEVRSRLERLPAECRRAWARIVGGA